jgi:hypothetical protein
MSPLITLTTATPALLKTWRSQELLEGDPGFFSHAFNAALGNAVLFVNQTLG